MNVEKLGMFIKTLLKKCDYKQNHATTTTIQNIQDGLSKRRFGH
jgi:hypothetical protein